MRTSDPPYLRCYACKASIELAVAQVREALNAELTGQPLSVLRDASNTTAIVMSEYDYVHSRQSKRLRTRVHLDTPTSWSSRPLRT
jgi:hypothetical protein